MAGVCECSGVAAFAAAVPPAVGSDVAASVRVFEIGEEYVCVDHVRFLMCTKLTSAFSRASK